jgi:DNA-binding XRE family transcriptional regulator
VSELPETVEITGLQCRLARAVAGMTQQDLSEASRLAKKTINALENGAAAYPSTKRQIRVLLEGKGVVFLDREGVCRR